jgi:hypothetical protein
VFRVTNFGGCLFSHISPAEFFCELYFSGTETIRLDSTAQLGVIDSGLQVLALKVGEFTLLKHVCRFRSSMRHPMLSQLPNQFQLFKSPI